MIRLRVLVTVVTTPVLYRVNESMLRKRLKKGDHKQDLTAIFFHNHVNIAAFHWARTLVFPSRKSGCSQNSEFPTWKDDFRLQWNDISYWETSFRAQWNAAYVTVKYQQTHLFSRI